METRLEEFADDYDLAEMERGQELHEEYPIKETPQRFKQLLHLALSEELISNSKGTYLANLSITEPRVERLLEEDTLNP